MACQSKLGSQDRQKLEDGLYRGTLRRDGYMDQCGCAAGEDGKGITIQPNTKNRVTDQAW